MGKPMPLNYGPYWKQNLDAPPPLPELDDFERRECPSCGKHFLTLKTSGFYNCLLCLWRMGLIPANIKPLPKPPKPKPEPVQLMLFGE